MLDSPVRISDSAKKEIIDTFIANKIPDDYGLRVGIKGRGCSGTLLLGFDTAGEMDKSYHIEGIKVFIDRRHLMYVLGAVIDYEVNDHGSGFTISSEKPEG